MGAEKKCIEKFSVLFRRSEAEASGNASIKLPISSERKKEVRATTRSARSQSSKSASGFSLKKVRISSYRRSQKKYRVNSVFFYCTIYVVK